MPLKLPARIRTELGPLRGGLGEGVQASDDGAVEAEDALADEEVLEGEFWGRWFGAGGTGRFVVWWWWWWGGG